MLALGLRYKKERERRERERMIIRRQFALAAQMLTAPDLLFAMNPDQRSASAEDPERKGQDPVGEPSSSTSIHRSSSEGCAARNALLHHMIIQKRDSGLNPQDLHELASILGISSTNRRRTSTRRKSTRKRPDSAEIKSNEATPDHGPRSSRNKPRKGTISEAEDCSFEKIGVAEGEECELKKGYASCDATPVRRKSRSKVRRNRASLIKSARSFFSCSTEDSTEE